MPLGRNHPQLKPIFFSTVDRLICSDCSILCLLAISTLIDHLPPLDRNRKLHDDILSLKIHFEHLIVDQVIGAEIVKEARLQGKHTAQLCILETKTTLSRIETVLPDLVIERDNGVFEEVPDREVRIELPTPW